MQKKNEFTNVLITGGAGFLGSHLGEFFLKKNLKVFLVDNFATGSIKNIEILKKMAVSEHQLQFIEADVTKNWDWAAKITDRISHVFHFASPASPPHYKRLGLETMWVNTIGLHNAIKFADERNAKTIFASTSEVYGDPDHSPQEETYFGNVNSFGVRSCYDEAKRFGESLIYTHNLKYKTNHGLVRIFNTYGPRMSFDDGRVIINFLVQAFKNEPLTIYGDGTQTRSFCYVDDLINGIVSYALTDLSQPVNIGNEGEFTLLELVDVIQQIYPTKNITKVHLPLEADDPKKRRPDLSLAKKVLAPWHPQVPLKQGLINMIKWLEEAI
jgi:nucleoside-diphosphate-sugar epimerase